MNAIKPIETLWVSARKKAEATYSFVKCVCDQSEIRHITKSNGTIGYVRQCLACGARVGSELPRKKITGSPPVFDELLRQRYQEKLRKNQEDIRLLQNTLIDLASKELQIKRRLFYESYLRTPEWRRRREKVIMRANGICEGCLSMPATQVHHLTYDNLGAEFAFELVAICEKCHDRYHAKQKQQLVGK